MPARQTVRRGVIALAATWAAAAAAWAQPYAQRVGTGAARFFESRDAFVAAPQTWAMVALPRHDVPATDFPLAPEFAVRDGKHIVTLKVPAGSSLYGLGREPGPLLRNGFDSKGRAVECPWVMVVRPDGTAFGMLADTTWEVSVDLTTDIVMSSAAPTLPVIVIEADGPLPLLTSLGTITGRTEMPPRWALGYLQEVSGTDEAIRATAAALRRDQIPTDGLILTGQIPLIGATDSPAARATLLHDLTGQGFHIVANVAPPPLAVDGPLLAQGSQEGLWMQTAPGVPGTANTNTVWPDVSRTSARQWWSDRVHDRLDAGLTGIELGDTPWEQVEGATLHPDGGEEPAACRQFCAALSGLLARATREGFREQRDDRRPVVLGPISCIAAPRWLYPTLPALDAAAGPADAVRPVLSQSLSGQSVVASRVPAPAKDRLREWQDLVGVDALMPMLIGPPEARDPGLDAAAAQTLRSALDRRSRFVPYLYTLGFTAFFDCEPIIRPVFFADQADASLRGVDSMFLIGQDLLAVPHPAEAQPPALPVKGAWRRVDLGDPNPAIPDLYLRPGAILPLGPVMQHTDESPLDPLTLVINPDDQGSARGALYEDSGDGYAFTHNQCRRTVYAATTQNGALFVRLATLDGGLPIPRRRVEVRILTDAGEVTGSGSERGTIKIELPSVSPKP